nr:MAG TPA: hypothetical protein [Caudoviricetes sp.]
MQRPLHPLVAPLIHMELSTLSTALSTIPVE